jgi:biopolymer transport protein ExbD
MSRSNKRNLSGRQIEEPTVNLTPLIDVVFVILIMFILVAPLLDLDRIELADAPNERTTANFEVHEKSPVSVHVHRDNTIWLNEKKVNADELIRLLKELKLKYPNAKLQLYQDKRGEFGTYQAVKNAAEQAGFQNMDIVLKPG